MLVRGGVRGKGVHLKSGSCLRKRSRGIPLPTSGRFAEVRSSQEEVPVMLSGRTGGRGQAGMGGDKDKECTCNSSCGESIKDPFERLMGTREILIGSISYA